MESLGPWQPTLLVPAGLVFLFVTFLSRARLPRIGAALVTSAIFAVGNWVWDLIGQPMGWWHYPPFVGRGYAPLWMYAAGGMVFGGAFGLIGWRAVRAYGWRGLFGFIAMLGVLGLARDLRVAQRFPTAIVFGAGVIPWILDFTAWASLAVLVQAAHWHLLGARRDEPLRTRV